MTLVDHARTELDLIGEDPAYAASLVAAIAALSSFGHSGGSMMCAIDQLNRLLRFENLAPLTSDPDEWIDQSGPSSYPIWQNKRCSSAFSSDGGATYYLLDDPKTILTADAPRPAAVDASGDEPAIEVLS